MCGASRSVIGAAQTSDHTLQTGFLCESFMQWRQRHFGPKQINQADDHRAAICANDGDAADDNGADADSGDCGGAAADVNSAGAATAAADDEQRSSDDQVP